MTIDSLNAEIRSLERDLAYGREHPYSGVCGEDDAAADRLSDLKAQLPFAVEYGVKGAHRITVKRFAELLEAEAFALRWSRSNSQGHYWAEITEAGKLVTRFNLA